MNSIISLIFVAGVGLVVRAFSHSRQHIVRTIGMYSGASLHVATDLSHVALETAQKLFTGSRFAPWGTVKQVELLLKHAGRVDSINYFRRQQFVWFVGGEIGFTVWLVLKSTLGSYIHPVTMLTGFIFIGVLSGWLALEFLKYEARNRAHIIDLELPVVLDLIAFSVAAGEPIILALNRVASTCSGALPFLIRNANAELQSGSTLTHVFREMRSASASVSLARAVHAIELAIEHGTPLAEVLRAQARESRSSYRQKLMTLAGKKETLMMVPVIFLILPMIVFVALFPGLQALQLN